MDRLILIQSSEFREIVANAVSEGVERSKETTARKTLTLNQLADEWQCSRQAILNWIKREHHPLPVHYLGSTPRFHRYEVESWSRAEGQRRLKEAA